MIRSGDTAPAAGMGSFADSVDRLVLTLSRRWLLALTLYGTALTALPVVAPMLKSAGFGIVSSPVYFAYQFICHQRADRSVHLHGEPMAFCVRDFAIFAGAVGVACVYGLTRRFLGSVSPGVWLVLVAVAPIGLDGLTQLLGLRESTTVLRVATGLIFSGGMGWYLLPRLDAGFRRLEADIRGRDLAELSTPSSALEARKG